MISSQVEESIIHNYILGHSRDEIAEETGIAPGSVSNKINQWKHRINAPDIEELRRIAVNMRNSEMTIKHCFKGFRLLQILKGLGITIENEDIDSDLDSLVFFVNEIYKKSKKVGITPAVITAWIDDVLNFSSKNYGYLYEFSKNHNERLSNKNQINKKNPLTFISVVSNFIEQKKRELEDLSEKRKEIEIEINQGELQKRELEEENKRLERKAQSILGFHNTFTNLSNILKKYCNIDLREDIEPFTKLFFDFMENGYDVTRIVAEYNKAVKLKIEIEKKEDQIKADQKQLTGLYNQIKTHESLLSIHKKNWDTYKGLEAMKFGIDELNQLWLTITEIASSRSISSEDAVAFFIKDVEDNYYDKLRFEDRVKEKRNELTQVNSQLFINRQMLAIQPFVGPLLVSLYQKGITEQEIIDMNQLFQNYLLEASKTDNNIDNNDESNTDVNNPLGKGIGYQNFIEELKKYGGIKAAIKHQSHLLDEIKNKNSDLIEQKEALLALCQNAIILINMLYNHYFYYKGFLDHHKLNDVYIVADQLSKPIVILVQNSAKEDKNSKEKDAKSDDPAMSSSDNNNNKSKDKNKD